MITIAVEEYSGANRCMPFPSLSQRGKETMKLSLGLAAVALASTVIAPSAQAATDVPAPSAARTGTAWLATQLTDGVIRNPNFVPGGFDDFGLTLDIGISLDEVGGDQALVRQLRESMAPRIDNYVTGVDYGSPEERYSGALSKSLVFAEVTGADPRAFGGFDLVQEVEARVTDSGPSAGRLADLTPYGDYANTFGQALAAHGLSVAGSPRAGAVTDFLLQQQCSSGYFRIFFNSDPAAAAQGCDEAVDGTDTDATALVVAQLSAIPSPPARVDTAIDRAVDWLLRTQKADGSFIGSAFTPDSNTNSTGLAASALAAGERCVEAGRAAEWVSSLQVGAQPVGSPLEGEEGALAYDSTAFAAAAVDGITDTSRDQWWRATVQAVAGLTHLRGSTGSLTVTSTGAEPGSSASLVARGAQVGDRFCLSGPGISGSRTVVVGSNGEATAQVTLPGTPGPATYTFTGRDGTITHAVTVRDGTTTHAVTVPSAVERGSVNGVRLVGPAGFQRAGSRASLEMLGAAAGARFVLRGPGVDNATVVVGSDGVLTRLVTLPKGTTTASYVLLGADGQVADDTRVLGKRRLKVSTRATDGPRTRVLVRTLAPSERVRLVVAGKTLAKGRANSKGRFVARVRLAGDRDKVRVRAVGQFPTIRSGAVTVRPR